MMRWGWDGFGHMGSWGWVGMILMGLFWIAVLVGLVLLVRYLVRRPEQIPQHYMTGTGQTAPNTPATQGGPTTGGALQILAERYARGEIEQEEFLRRKADLTA